MNLLKNCNLPDCCWFRKDSNKVKIDKGTANKYNLTSDVCHLCQFAIISKPYQQSNCGSRYCRDCYNELDEKFYCEICKVEDPENFVHKKSEVFVDKAWIKDMEKHKVTCPDCNIEMIFFELENHVEICKDGWVECAGCKSMITRKVKHLCPGRFSSQNSNLKHKICQNCGKQCQDLNEHQEECNINWNFYHCPYGCDLNKKETIEEHRKEKCLFHLDKAWAIMQSHGLTEGKKEKSSIHDNLVKSITDNVKKSLRLDIEKISRLADEIKSLNETTKEEISIYESIKNSLKYQIFDSLHTSFDGTILWKIDNFEEVKNKAIKGDQRSIFSPPFYTSRFGYKMCLRLYPNGDSTAKDVAMSLFLVILKGNYDSMLNWPFKQKVTFILLDQEFKTNMIDAFVPSDNLTSFSRPRTDMNIPSGSSYFIKFEDMKLHKYVKDNTIFIRCIIDCSDLHE